jgi:hypothetical protein
MTGLKRVIFVAVISLIAAATPGRAQMNPAPGQRMFDLVSGIVFTCGSATGFAWTGEACDTLAGEFKKRAAAAKLPFAEVPITADFRTRRFETVDGFARDKAVRVFWNFTESTGTKGRISAALSSSRIYEPKDISNAAPGQRIPLNFYAQSAQFEPGVTLKQARPYLQTITDTFFEVGAMKN